MYYEIYFEPDTGKWRIRISYVWLGIFISYKIVVGESEGKVPAATRCYLEFSTHDEAVTHVARVGLAKVYTLKDISPRGRAVQAIAAGAA